MTKEELIKLLIKTNEEIGHEPMVAHQTADNLLLDYIDDKDVRNAFEAIERWYA